MEKTKYCIHHSYCDREEDCLNGHFCSFFQSNPDISSEKPEEDPGKGLRNFMDDIWDGKKETRR